MTDTNKYSTTLGPWANSDFAGTARTTINVGADADLPDDVRFIAGVAKLILRRLAEIKTGADPVRPAVFFLESNAPACKSGIMPKRVPMLDNGLTTLTGRLWFMAPVVVTGRYIELEECDDDELFKIVTDDLLMGEVPAVVFDPRTKIPELRFYPSGLKDPVTCHKAELHKGQITLEEIFQVIDHVHRTLLVTPEAQSNAGKLWSDNMKYWPVENAEDTIQLYLRAGLTTAFPACTVRHEQTSVPGRLDLEIEQSDPLDRGDIVRHAILELKVLRSFSNTGKTIYTEQDALDGIEKGVKQAATYRDDKDAKAAALCCFDMRRINTGEKCFEHVTELAKRLVVVLRRWFIYATSEQYREAITVSS